MEKGKNGKERHADVHHSLFFPLSLFPFLPPVRRHFQTHMTFTIRLFLVAIAGLWLAGCDALEPPRHAPEAAPATDETARAEARKQFGLFLAEADRGAAMLAAHPAHDALRDGSRRLHELLERAAEADRSAEKMEELIGNGRIALRYFDACLKVADYQARRKDVDPQKAKKFIDKTCDGNLPPFRELLATMKIQFESEGPKTSDSPDRPSGVRVQEPRGRNGG